MDGPEIEVYRAVRAHELELNRAAIGFEHAILAPLFLLNGGAIVAFLTLLGATTSTSSNLDVAPACISWAGGLLLGVAANYFVFHSQRRFTRVERLRRQEVERELLLGNARLTAIVTLEKRQYDRERERKGGERWQLAMNLAIGGSVLAFLTGAWFAATSML